MSDSCSHWKNTARFAWGITLFLALQIAHADQTAARATLGAALFQDVRLSANETFSCATCHDPNNHYTDGRQVAIGVFGDQLSRNTPTLYNSAQAASLGWDEPGFASLENQHRQPLFGQSPPEMAAIKSQLPTLLEHYHQEVLNAFGAASASLKPAEAEQIIVAALAAYVSTLTYPSNGLDAYLYTDDASQFSAAARRGLTLFISERLGCANCHKGPRLGGPDKPNPPTYHYTGVAKSKLRFRAPTLRAVGATAPYMHGGQLASLEAVIDHYQSTPSSEVNKFKLSPGERSDLIAFLRSL